MAWKFFNIGKANEEITRLENEVAKRDETIKSLEAEKKSLAENDNDVAKAAADIQGQLDQANTNIKALEKERDQLKVDLDKANASTDGKAAKKALEITGAQGQPPISTGAPGTPGGSDAIEKQLDAITDPTERTIFYRKHKAEIRAAAVKRHQAGN